MHAAMTAGWCYRGLVRHELLAVADVDAAHVLVGTELNQQASRAAVFQQAADPVAKSIGLVTPKD